MGATENKKHLIVVVDDEMMTCEMLKRMLESEPDLEVQTAHDGRKGFALIREKRPSLAILDLDMPIMTGLEVLRAMKEDQRTLQIPAIMLTAHDSEENLREALHWYVDTFLIKPCTKDVLLAKVRRVLGYRVKRDDTSAEA